MKKMVKKLVTIAVSIAMVCAMALPAMASDGLYGECQSETVISPVGGNDKIAQQFVDLGGETEDDFSELWKDTNYAAVANDYGEVAWFPVGDSYYDPKYDDSYTDPWEEAATAYEAVGLSPEWKTEIHGEQSNQKWEEEVQNFPPVSFEIEECGPTE